MKMKVSISTYERRDMLGYANVVFDDKYALEHVMIKTKGDGGYYVVLPEITKKSGEIKEIFHPATADARLFLDRSIIQAYHNAKNGQRETEFVNDMPPMNVTNVRTAQYEKDYIVGLANVKFSDGFVLEGAQIKTGQYGEYVDLPKYRRPVTENGRPVYTEEGKPKMDYREVFKPITKESAAELKKAVVDKFYEQHINKNVGESLMQEQSQSRGH